MLFGQQWIHVIWATKERAQLIDFRIEKRLYDFMFREFKELGCSLLAINGMPDHIHCLLLLSNNRSIADVVKQVKGSSAHYMNSHNIIAEKFSWQTGYAAFSVSKSVVPKVKNYIDNQKAHHGGKLFAEELAEFLKLHGIEENLM